MTEHLSVILHCEKLLWVRLQLVILTQMLMRIACLLQQFLHALEEQELFADDVSVLLG